MRGKRFMAVLLSTVLTAAGAMTAWALPTGLSSIEGSTVRSSMAGFEATFPAVTRWGDTGETWDWIICPIWKRTG